jgi:hypothetical protein
LFSRPIEPEAIEAFLLEAAETSRATAVAASAQAAGGAGSSVVPSGVGRNP